MNGVSKEKPKKVEAGKKGYQDRLAKLMLLATTQIHCVKYH